MHLTPMEGHKPARLAHIDALRGLAALLVVWEHVAQTFIKLSPAVVANGTALYDISNSTNFGRIGVLLFFAISGFVIPNSLKGGVRDGANTFLISRFFRLFPLFWVSIPLGLVFLYWVPGRTIDTASIFANFTMIPAFLGFKPLMGLYWTLAVELIFYGLCLLLFCKGKNNHVGILALCAVLLGSVFAVRVWGYDLQWLGFKIHPQFAYYCSFVAIMFWGALYRQWYDRRSHALTLLLIAVTLIVFATGLKSFYFQIHKGITQLPMITKTQLLPPIIFILGTTVFKVRYRFCSWLGEISYSLYLLHSLVFYSLFRLLKALDIEALLSLHLSVYLLVCMGLSLLLASASYRLVERPAIRLGKRLSSRLRPALAV